MRLSMVAFIGMLCLAAGGHSAYGMPLASGGSLLAASSKAILPAKTSCPKGQRWVPAGYAKHGKYRAGHCAPK